MIMETEVTQLLTLTSSFYSLAGIADMLDTFILSEQNGTADQ